MDRLEHTIQTMVEGRAALRKMVADLATEMQRAFDQVAEQFAETGRRRHETYAQMRDTGSRINSDVGQIRETDARMNSLDERIDDLVRAIRELTRRNPSRN